MCIRARWKQLVSPLHAASYGPGVLLGICEMRLAARTIREQSYLWLRPCLGPAGQLPEAVLGHSLVLRPVRLSPGAWTQVSQTG